MPDIAIFCMIGMIGGLFVGLLSAGIGPIVIPSLLFLLPTLGVPHEIIMQVAITTSLSIILVTSAMSSYLHYKNNTVHWGLFRQLLPGSVLGALIGSLIVMSLSGMMLRVLFSILLIGIGIHMSLLKGRALSKKTIFPSFHQFFVTSSVIAMLSNMLGISDGLLLIPYLKRYNILMTEAVGTATALVLPVCFVGMIPLLFSGMQQTILPPQCWAYIYLPAFWSIGITSVIFSMLGVSLGRKLPDTLLKSIFGCGLIAIGVKMLL